MSGDPIDNWIRESNLIEGIDNEKDDQRCQDAWDWFSKEKISVRNILQLHKRIMTSQLEKYAGIFRDCQVYVGGNEGAPWREVPRLMAQWVTFYGDIRISADDDFVAAAIKLSHIAFERIHPFVDGNGRVGRMLLNRQRIGVGLKPLMLRASERHRYYEWFK